MSQTMNNLILIDMLLTTALVAAGLLIILLGNRLRNLINRLYAENTELKTQNQNCYKVIHDFEKMFAERFHAEKSKPHSQFCLCSGCELMRRIMNKTYYSQGKK